MRTVWPGLGAVACGALLCMAGWFGVSGERFAERQIPWLASCTVPGAALIVAGAGLLAGWRPAPPARPVAVAPAGPSATGPLVRVPGGTLAHRPDCPLVDGRPEAFAADPADPADPADGLTPCPVCEPPWPP
ncbi:hypothetical protein OG625_30220 [Streptomyces sp. NBC_01351]|uniref:hypothetical protein n=1 Tax=Streptomyces sp. NBC_01351 TaxID=2903833 RepID=UPI002E3781A2|nr:hypothetical protein [Streptomyces sp. NBC_01351]